MFRVEKQEHINKTFRMPAELVHELEELAQNKGVSMNQLVVQCCRYALDNLEEEKEP